MQLRFLTQIKIESSINVNQNQKFCIQEFKLFQLAIYKKKLKKTNTKTYFFHQGAPKPTLSLPHLVADF